MPLLQVVEPLRVLREPRARMRNLQALRERAQRERLRAQVRGPSRRRSASRAAPAFRASVGLSGTAASAAADGVGARRSATKSAMVTSTSWPTPRHRRARGRRQCARATRSSLKHQRSSSEPPPRATMSTSHSSRRDAGFDGAHDLRHRGRALHGGGVEQHARRGKPRAQHAQDVVDGGAGGRGDHADAARHRRQRPLALGGKQSFGGEPGLELLELALERAFAGFLEVLDEQLVFAARLVEPDARARQHRHAVLRPEPHRRIPLAPHRAAHLRLRSLSEKYQWPEAGAAKFESSPSSHSSGRPDSSSSRTSLLRRETL